MDNEGNRDHEQSERDMILRSSTCAPKIIRIKSWSVVSFFKLIDEELDDFLDDDQCCLIADNYLIAMVFTYFLRASLRPEEYTKTNFFTALYLAHDMEEDRDDARMMLRDHMGLDDPGVRCSAQTFFQRKDIFWRRMAHRGAVSRLCCDKVMQMIKPSHKIWTRKRHVNHSGATRDFYGKENGCPNCPRSQSSLSSNSASEFSPEIYSLRRPTISEGKILNPCYSYKFESK